MPTGYNKDGTHNGVSTRFKKGYKMSEEHARKIKVYFLSKVGKSRPKEIGEKISKAKTGKKHSEETKRKISLSKKGQNKGSKCHLWKGGITPINQKIRNSTEYKLWRTAVFKRDNYRCVWGGEEHGSKLNADHIKPFSQYPELRFAIDNGRTLCVECHRKTNTFGNKKKIT